MTGPVEFEDAISEEPPTAVEVNTEAGDAPKDVPKDTYIRVLPANPEKT